MGVGERLRVGPGGANAEGKRRPPVLNRRVVDSRGELAFFDVAQTCGVHQLGEVACTSASQTRFVYDRAVEVARGSPKWGQWRAPSFVIPHARCDDAARTRDAPHLRKSNDWIGHEMHDELCERGVEAVIRERHSFGGGNADIDTRVTFARRVHERLGGVDSRHCIRPDPKNAFGRQSAGTTPHVKHALTRMNATKVGELRRQLRRIP